MNGNGYYDLPSDLNQVITVTRYEILKHLRSKRLFGIFALELLLIAVIMVVPPALGRDYPSDPAEFSQLFTQGVWILIIVGATLFSGDALVAEFQGRTGYLIFPNPVRRRVIFAGKFFASIGIVAVALGAYYGVSSILVFAVVGSLSNLTLSSFGLALLFSVAACSIGFLISSVMKGSTGALVLTFATFFPILMILDNILTFARVKPDFSINFAAGAIGYVMESPYPTDIVRPFPLPGDPSFEIAYYYPEIGIATLVALAYIVATLVLSLFFFSRREMSA
ncbi:MAG: ABC transporter permease [Euryarchaeota archaeon]|nr:ABC transporter permease [Euryarchaeota archaeon]